MIIGRKQEQKELREAYEAKESRFVAVYGRRRVGKTFLIRETFGYKFTFEHVGLAKTRNPGQLKNFQLTLIRSGWDDAPLPADWLEAFFLLEQFLEASTDERKVVFIDEIPWMDNVNSGFLPALEHFWNSWATTRNDIVLIVCGSATSWIVKNIINNYGGLHDRITNNIFLEPFTLLECRKLAESMHLEMVTRQIMECYMVMGGVPYYWSLLKRDLSLAQNIDELFFKRNGRLRNEFKALYSSLFRHPEPYIAVINVLGTKKAGMTREEIVTKGDLTSNGKLSEVLEDLETCGFIRSYTAYGSKKKDRLFQLIDNFTLFYFKFMASQPTDEHHWTNSIGTPEYNTWCGLAFERLCLQHVRQIKQKLGISGIVSQEYSWRSKAAYLSDPNQQQRGAQIDLLIDRKDGDINLCEMKYSKEPFTITAQYAGELNHKREQFIKETGTKSAIRLTMITSCGLTRNAYSDEIPNQIIAEDLFAE